MPETSLLELAKQAKQEKEQPTGLAAMAAQARQEPAQGSSLAEIAARAKAEKVVREPVTAHNQMEHLQRISDMIIEGDVYSKYARKNKELEAMESSIGDDEDIPETLQTKKAALTAEMDTIQEEVQRDEGSLGLLKLEMRRSNIPDDERRQSIKALETLDKKLGSFSPFKRRDNMNREIEEYVEGFNYASYDNTDEGMTTMQEDMRNGIGQIMWRNDFELTSEGDILDRRQDIVDSQMEKIMEGDRMGFLRNMYLTLASGSDRANAAMTDVLGFVTGLNHFEWYQQSRENYANRANVLKEKANRYDGLVEDYLKHGDISQAIGATATMTAESLPMMIPVLLSAAAGQPQLGLTAMGAMTGATKYREIEMEDLPEWQRVLNAVTAGATEAILSGVFTAPIIMRSKAAITAMGAKTVKDNIRKQSGVMIKNHFPRVPQIVQGSIEEGLIQINHNLTDKLTFDPDRSLSEGVIDGMVAGGAMAATFASPQLANWARNKFSNKEAILKNMRDITSVLPVNMDVITKTQVIHKMMELKRLEDASRISETLKTKHESQIAQLNQEIGELIDPATRKTETAPETVQQTPAESTPEVIQQTEIADRQKTADQIVEAVETPRPPVVTATDKGFTFRRVGQDTPVKVESKADAQKVLDDIQNEQQRIEEIQQRREAEQARDGEMRGEYPYRLLDQRFKTKKEFLDALRKASQEGADHMIIMTGDVMQGDTTMTEMMQAMQTEGVGTLSQVNLDVASQEHLQAVAERNIEAAKVAESLRQHYDKIETSPTTESTKGRTIAMDVSRANETSKKVGELETQLDNLRTEKAPIEQQRDLISKFIEANKQELRELTGAPITTLLKRVNEATTPATTARAVTAMQKAIQRGMQKRAKAHARRFIADLKAIRTKRAKKAVNILQEGVDLREKVLTIAQMTDQQVADTRTEVEAKLEHYEQRAQEAMGDALTQAEALATEAAFDLYLLDMYGNLEGKKPKVGTKAESVQPKTLQEVANAIEAWKNNYKNLRQQFKDARETELKRRQDQVTESTNEIAGSKALAESRRKTLPPAKRRKIGEGRGKNYQAMMGSIASLTHSIWGGHKAGLKAADFFKSGLYNMYKAIDRAIGYKAELQHTMKQSVDGIMADVWGSKRKGAAELNQETNITLEYDVLNEAGEVTGTESMVVPISNDTAGFLWASFQSESNSAYMDNIHFRNRKYRLTQEGFNSLDGTLSDNVKTFADLLTHQYFGSDNIYNQINDVYEAMTHRRLPRLPGYLPVNATSWRNKLSVGDLDNFGIFKQFTKERVGGALVLDNNGLYQSSLKYADDVASFIHLARPVSDMVYTLNSNPVRAVLADRGLSGKGDRIISLLEKGYQRQRPSDASMFDGLLRRFVQTKILMNYNLAPKQLTSIVTALDADFGNPLGVLKEMTAIISQTAGKERLNTVRDLIHNHPDLRFRYLTDVLSLTQAEQRAKINPLMFGETRSDIAMGMLATTLWNPTAAFDRAAITMGGLPVALHNYNTGLAEAQTMGLNPVDAKAYAAQKATDMLGEFINRTQQSAKMTHKGAFQYDGWRAASAFMNAVMGYARQVTRHSRDIVRDYQAGRVRYMDGGDSGEVASAKALADIRPAKLQSLFLYTSVLPTLFSTVSTLGGNFKRLSDQDEDVRAKARRGIIFDATFGWTKGLFGVGFLLEYAMNEVRGGYRGRRSDNIVRTLDDVFEFIDSIGRIINLSRAYNDESIKNRPLHEQKIYKALQESSLRTGAFGLGVRFGTPTVFINRLIDVTMTDDYEESAEVVSRLYGLPKAEIKYLFDEAKKDQHQYPRISN